MRRALLLGLLLLAACSRPDPECVQSVTQFRATLRTDPTLAKVPDTAIAMARAHHEDKSTECVLANGFADDAEQARLHPEAEVAPTATAAAVDNGVPGTPRVHFEITPTPRPTPTPDRPRYLPPPTDTDPVANSGGGGGNGPSTPASTPAAVPSAPQELPRGTVDPKVACHVECDKWANRQARIACNQRCDGATPLPGGTDAPTIIH